MTSFEDFYQECEHANVERRRMWIASPGKVQRYQVVDQCNDCGARPNNNVYKQSPTDHDVLPEFNQELRDLAFERKQRARERYQEALRNKREESRDSWWRDYASYLDSPEWGSKRQRVLKRDGYRCTAGMSGCTEWANEVHHLDYRFVGNEPDFTLQSVCKSCHDHITAITRRSRERAA